MVHIDNYVIPPSILSEMCSERDSPLEPFVLPAPGLPELAWLTSGAHLGPHVLTRKQKCPRVNSLVYDRAAAFCAAGPPEVLFTSVATLRRLAREIATKIVRLLIDNKIENHIT